MKEIDEENKTLLRLKNESGINRTAKRWIGHITNDVEKTKKLLTDEEEKLRKKIDEITIKQRIIENAQKEKEDAKKATAGITTQIRKLERKASRWKTDTKVRQRKDKCVGSNVHWEKEGINETEKEVARSKEKLRNPREIGQGSAQGTKSGARSGLISED